VGHACIQTGRWSRTFVIPHMSPVPRAGEQPALGGRALRAAAVTLLGAALALPLAACSASAVYVSSTGQGMFFKLPQGWHVFSQAQLKRSGFVLDVNQTSAANDVAMGNNYPVFYNLSSPNSHIASSGALDYASAYPWAVASVVAIGQQSQPTITLAQLNDEFFNVDGLPQEGGSAVTLVKPTLLVTGALRGMRIAYRIKPPSGTGFSYEQVALLNSATTKLWLLDVGCSWSCFDAHQTAIEAIAASLTVKPPVV
jgi:hypothetical protein